MTCRSSLYRSQSLASLVTLLAIATILPSRSLAFQLTRGSRRILASFPPSSHSSTAFQRIPGNSHCHLISTSRAQSSALKMTATSSSASCAASTVASSNPLLQSWSSQPFNLPPFAQITPAHFKPAFDVAMENHLADLQKIVDDESEPTFDNVIAPYDRAGPQLGKVGSVFGNLCSSQNTDDLQTDDETTLGSRGRCAGPNCRLGLLLLFQRSVLLKPASNHGTISAGSAGAQELSSLGAGQEIIPAPSC